MLHNPPNSPFIAVRTTGEPGRVVDVVARRWRGLSIRVSCSTTSARWSDLRGASLAERRFVLTLVAGFGLLALVLAVVGVYGVLALVVAERTPELGLRMALGAAPASVVRLVVGAGVAPDRHRRRHGSGHCRRRGHRHEQRARRRHGLRSAAPMPSCRCCSSSGPRLPPWRRPGGPSRVAPGDDAPGLTTGPQPSAVSSSRHQPVEARDERADRGGLRQVDAGLLQQRHRVIAAAGPQQVEIAADAVVAARGIGAAHRFHQRRRRRHAGRVLVDVVRRLEEVRDARPGPRRALVARDARRPSRRRAVRA